ncbi:MAG TPA: MerR family transcriptional regulator [Sandaracinaceae bacterium LLY-WYZ-13_1]|nr:MerR family transcriptional regulator [Sandaracinaceae bacterium LLY-WYZ-13_1]
MTPPRPLPDKLFFRIGEVAELVGVKPHVLRYWEGEFRALSPMKTRGAHRQYRRRDVELAMLIKQLVHDEGYTIAGARKKLRELGHDRRGAPVPEEASREVQLRAALLGVREELTGLLEQLDRMEDEAEREAETPHEVTVHRSVPVPARRDRWK